jgi:hypothetical protein
MTFKFYIVALAVASLLSVYYFKTKDNHVVSDSVYDANLSLELVRMSKVPHCEINSIDNWSCAPCKYFNNINQPAGYYNSTNDAQGFIAYSMDLNAIVISFRGTTST